MATIFDSVVSDAERVSMGKDNVYQMLTLSGVSPEDAEKYIELVDKYTEDGHDIGDAVHMILCSDILGMCLKELDPSGEKLGDIYTETLTNTATCIFVMGYRAAIKQMQELTKK